MNNGQHRWFVISTSGLPLIGTLIAIWLAVRGMVSALDVTLFSVMYVVAVVGVTVGFHRLLAHRAFMTTPVVRNLLVAAGSMAAQGPVIVWVAHHRRHHRLADSPGDPHSPHVDLDGRVLGGWEGWWHAHMGWLFDRELSSDHIRYCPELARDKALRWMSIHFFGFVTAGAALPAVLGGLITRSLSGALTGFLWGGLVRIFVVNQITYTINSLGHMIGRRDRATRDRSGNLAWLAILSFGESWHNNHHASPRAARFGRAWWQIDPGGDVVALLLRFRIARPAASAGP